MEKEKEEKKAVLLPAELYGRIENRAEVTGFGSVDEYVIFILREVLEEEEEETTTSKAEEEEVKKRLKALGYLD